MNKSTVTISVAGLRIKYSAQPPLSFSPIEYRGFAIEDTTDTILHVTVVDVTGQSHSEDGRTDYFVGDCRGTEMPDHRWEIGLTADQKEYIAIDFYTETLPYNWIKLIFGNSEGTLYVSRRNASHFEIDPYCYPLSNILISRLLKRYDSFLVHSSVVDDNGNGYLFTAVSGTGKSTMARIWESCGATIINDDMLALRTDGEGIVANNIPMPYYNDVQRSVTLKGIFLISQSPDDYVREITGAKAVLKLSSNTIYQPCNKMAAITHLKNVEKVSQAVPIYELGFKISDNIVRIIRQLHL